MKNQLLTDYMQSLILQLRAENRHGTARTYQSTLNRILAFVGDFPLHFHQVTPAWLKSFQDHLLARHLAWNTVSTYLRMLRATYSRAVDDGHAPLRPRLFKGVYTGTRSNAKRAVDEEVIRHMGTTPCDDPLLDDTAQLFLLMFLLRGIPFADLVFLRPCDLRGDVLTYRRRKTGTWMSVRVEPEAMAIIRHFRTKDPSAAYLFPFIRQPGEDEYRQYQNALRSFNYRLGKLSQALGGGVRLTTYSARHSWATIANFHHFHQELISNAMGHSSVKVTETYFKAYADEGIDRMNREIIRIVFK